MELIAVRLTDSHICMRTPYSLIQVCKAVPGGTWNPNWKCWQWPREASRARALLDAFGPRLSHADGAQFLRDLAPQTPVARPQDAIVAPDSIPGIRTTPWLHQRQAYAFARDKSGAMLAMGMGTGKSLVAVALLYDRPLSLIICPKAVMAVWPKEFERHAAIMPDVVVLDMKGSKDKGRVLGLALRRTQTSGRPLVAVINYEAAWRDYPSEVILSTIWDAVVLDESHKIKAPAGRASRFCSNLRKRAKHVYGLTGTPMPHSPMDIYAQYRAIDDSLFGRNFSKFRARYAIMGGFGGNSVIGYQNAEELSTLFLKAAFQAGRECIDLPDAVHQDIPVVLEKAARSAYASLSKDFYAQLATGEVTASNALVKLLRLQQLTGGYLKLDDGSIERVDTAKREALTELLEGMGGEPSVVFCRFTADIQTVKDACADLGVAVCELSGAANDLAAWQDGKYQCIAVQIQSGGAGVDLTRARYCIYFSLGFSLGDYDQSLCRIHRPGQSLPVTYYHLIATDSIDEQVYAALQQRRDVVESIIKPSGGKE